uniref:NADP-dependent oxidoreductase domain-containing protein n=1 Tax=Megaselia scalaris TaxID=36166 RepID=T1GQN4_MEGSC
MTKNLAPKLKLNNGLEMPCLGFGTFLSNENEAEESVKNEVEVGRAVNQKIREGIVTRSDLFITSKIGGIHHDPSLVEHACRLSLKKLNLEYLDLLLIHFPVGMRYISDNILHTQPNEADYLDTWHAMEKLVDLGLVKSIGVSNFNSQQTERIVQNCRIKPVTNQVECHPAFNQKKLIEYSKKHGIVITAYAPLARPQPENRWPRFLYDSTAKALEQKYNKNSAQICLRYLIQIGVIPIPKSVTKSRIQSNFDVFDFELSEEDMKIMDNYNTGRRMIPFSGLRNHIHYPFGIEY